MAWDCDVTDWMWHCYRTAMDRADDCCRVGDGRFDCNMHSRSIMSEIINISNIINALLFVVMTLGGWWLKHLQEKLEQLTATNAVQDQKIQEMALSVEREFIRKTELSERLEQISRQLERIENKLENKVDKS